MEITLKRVRLAFPAIWEPKPFNGKGEPRCDAQFLIDPKLQPELVMKIVDVMQKLAVEKWKEKAVTTLQSLKAKGDLCLHDGNTKAEYDGFAGNLFISASNKIAPHVVHKSKVDGAVVYLDQQGNGFVNGKKLDGFRAKAPYSGCYVNANIDIWIQDNQYGKRINAKLLAIQFEDDGDAFSGGAGFDEANFDYSDEDSFSATGESSGFGFDTAGASSASFGFDTAATSAAGDDGFFSSNSSPGGFSFG